MPTGKAGFSEALKAYAFFTRRYTLVFYSVLAFAIFFAIIVSLVSIGLVFLNLFTGNSVREEVEFTLMVLIFFGIGFQALMAFASIAFNLWAVTFRERGPNADSPPLEQSRIIREYYDSSKNPVAKFLAFALPALFTTLVMTVPLFAMVLLFMSYIEFDQAPFGLLRDIFIPDLFLVGLSVFLVNFNYYLETRTLKKPKAK